MRGIFFSFQRRLDWCNELLLHLVIDGPNINASFEKKINKNFHENNVLNIGSCSLHKVHNAFHKCLFCLTFNLDRFACDIYLFFIFIIIFFKLPSSRKEDYASLEEVT